jgi:hypothetical protein
MSFYTGTQAELLYCMPATGASVTSTVSTASTAVLTPAAAAATQPFQLPSYFFPNTGGIGKSVMIQGGGVLLNGPATQTARFALYLDTAINVQGTLLCATGAFSPFGTTVSQTGAFFFHVLITATSIGTTCTLNTVGKMDIGQAGNTATNTTTATMLMNSSTQPTINNATAYYIEMFANFGATTTTQAVTLTNFYVWGLN